ncbi:imidazoleglycerol-phosphate dehydratase HisB [Methanospirillum lacunae]|uniref:Imidazoleglycerol-phosphate dehydratase n=1 Tax=Methanospirillum lacunae TaxID=668570 RepID=A0A2V2N8X6_9EURY|nr:imidazoleglycerol-phosphate dehydratase HisB [Methanospirillum lacunae]PWR74116.1 imidazoleglycerol-phosphate dehydratase HisB [Methanospirillum lacunae]
MRTGSISRETRETKIKVDLNLDGNGICQIETGIPFFDHMLESFGRHGRFDLTIRADGDLNVGPHHTIEDIAIVLGSALREAIGDGRGIRRFSHAIIPMDEARVMVTTDISGRPYCVFSGVFSGPIEGVLEPYLIEHFFTTLTSSAHITLHLEGSGRSDHHLCEAFFKACGVTLHEATRIIDPNGNIPSTKGIL